MPCCSQPQPATPGWCLAKQSLFSAQLCRTCKFFFEQKILCLINHCITACDTVNYTSASGILTSPSYPNPYPAARDCIYLISLPVRTFVNLTLTTMDIVCQEMGSTSDYIEIRDGKYEDSPLIGKFCGNGSNLPALMQTTQNNLRVRYWAYWG